MLVSPSRTKQPSTVALVTCVVVTGLKAVVRMCLGSNRTVELSTGGFFLLKVLHLTES